MSLCLYCWTKTRSEKRNQLKLCVKRSWVINNLWPHSKIVIFFSFIFKKNWMRKSKVKQNFVSFRENLYLLANSYITFISMGQILLSENLSLKRLLDFFAYPMVTGWDAGTGTLSGAKSTVMSLASFSNRVSVSSKPGDVPPTRPSTTLLLLAFLPCWDCKKMNGKNKLVIYIWTTWVYYVSVLGVL